MNSIGGAVKLFSKKPDGEEGNMLDVLYGSRNHIEARGSSDFVVIPDQLFVRMSAVYNHQDGYVNVFDFGCSHPSFTATPVNPMTGVPNGPAGTYSVAPSFVTHAGNCLKNQEGGTDYQGLRLAARWLPSSNLEINVSGDITQQDQENAATTCCTRTNRASLSGDQHGDGRHGLPALQRRPGAVDHFAEPLHKLRRLFHAGIRWYTGRPFRTVAGRSGVLGS